MFGVSQLPCSSSSQRLPVGSVAVEVGRLVVVDRVDVGVGDRMDDVDRIRGDLDRRAGDRQHARRPGLREPVDERPLVGEDRQLVAANHVEVEQLVVEEDRRAGARDDGPGADRLDVPHRPGELALDLGLAQHPLLGVGHVVHHRVPDRAGVLQPVQVDRAVGVERFEVGRPAVVLVDEAGATVGHDHRRVAARAIGDRRLDVDRDRQPGRQFELLAVGGADELGEPELAERALLFPRRVAGQQDRDVAAQVLAQPRLVVVIGVEVRDVEVVGVLDAVTSSSASSWSLRGNTNHEPKNAGTNQGSHRIDPAAVSMRMPAWPIEVAAACAGASGDRRIGVLLTGPRDVLGPLVAVPVPQLEATGRVGVPTRWRRGRGGGGRLLGGGELRSWCRNRWSPRRRNRWRRPR